MNNQEILNKFEEFFRTHNEFDKSHNFKFKIHEPGKVTYYLTVDESHLSSPHTIHGGVIAAMMDCTLGVAALSKAVVQKKLVSTVEFKVNYFHRVKPKDELESSGWIDFEGKSLMVTSAEIISKNSGNMIAKAIGTFNIYPAEKNEFFSKFLKF